MNAGPELPLPAAEIVERLNVRRRIPLTTWTLTVVRIALLPRGADQDPLIEAVVDVTGPDNHNDNHNGNGRWAVRFPVPPPAAAAPFVLLLKVRLESWWLTRNQHDPVRAVREGRPRGESMR